jgi:hypothetical protein
MFYCNASENGRVTTVKRPKEGSKKSQKTAAEATYIAGSVANEL